MVDNGSYETVENVEQEDEEIEIFNKKKVYSEKILPLLTEANNICRENNIPFFAIAMTSITNKEVIYPWSYYNNDSDSGLSSQKITLMGFLATH